MPDAWKQEAADLVFNVAKTPASAALLALFVAIELRSRAPIMPFSIFRIRAVTGSNVASLALGGAVFGMIFILTLYMQQVLAYSPIETGLAWLAMSLTALACSAGHTRPDRRDSDASTSTAG